jgi:hypothetical protein
VPNGSSSKTDETRHKEKITEYEQVREELRQTSELTNQRVARGLTVIGFIVAYALLARNSLVFVSLVPVVLAVLLILSIQSGIILRMLGERSRKIEEDLQYIRWEHYLSDIRKDLEFDRYPFISSIWFPAFVVYLSAGFTYAGFVVLSLFVILNRFNTKSMIVALIAYVILTVLVLASLKSYFKVLNSDEL